MDGVEGIDFLPDNSEETLRMLPAMAGRCGDCAYTHGTSASLDVVTRRLADECAKARCVFFCHKTFDGMVASHICAGWIETLST